MRARVSWLSEAEKELIVQEALGLLERVGVGLSGTGRMAELAAAGARVDEAAGVVRFPPELVMDAVARIPRRVVMAGVAPEYDVVLDEGQAAHFCSSGCAAFVLDHGTGVRRPSTLADLQAATALLDETDALDLMWTTITANDVPIEVRELVGYYAVLCESHKHVTFVDSPSQADPVIRMIDIVSSGEEDFRERPRFSTLFTVASPLKIDGELLDFHAATAARGVPVEVYTVPMAGATSPVSVAGTVVQGLAEFLAAATALQTLAPGARLIMGSSGSVLDMRSAGISYAAPEAALMNAASVELAHHLGFPAAVPGLSTDAKHPGEQAGWEKALKGLTTAAAEADVISGGMGMIDSVNTLYLPQIVLDAEIVGMIHRLLAEVEVTRESMFVEMIERQGIGGNFLKEKETTRRLRAGEHYLPLVSARQGYDAWKAEGRDEVDLAAARMGVQLAARAERAPALNAEQRRELAAVCGVTGEMARALGH